jgi:hypothetical protein
MIELKLVEYNLETGEFERFLELGKGFGYFGNYIAVSSHLEIPEYEEAATTEFDRIKNGTEFLGIRRYIKDEKDPLNRFDGLFDGRTYGNGRFVLMCGFQIPDESAEISQYIHWQDCIYEVKKVYSSEKVLDILKVLEITGNHYGAYPDTFEFENVADGCSSGALSFIEEDGLKGNIHENPELWEKVRRLKN